MPSKKVIYKRLSIIFLYMLIACFVGAVSSQCGLAPRYEYFVTKYAFYLLFLGHIIGEEFARTRESKQNDS